MSVQQIQDLAASLSTEHNPTRLRSTLLDIKKLCDSTRKEILALSKSRTLSPKTAVGVVPSELDDEPLGGHSIPMNEDLRDLEELRQLASEAPEPLTLVREDSELMPPPAKRKPRISKGHAPPNPQIR